MAAGMRLRLMTNGSPTPHVPNPIKTGRGRSGWRWVAGIMVHDRCRHASRRRVGSAETCQCGDPMFAFSRGLLHRNTKASHQSPQSPVRRHQSLASVCVHLNRSPLGRHGLPRGAQRSTAQHSSMHTRRHSAYPA
jgi:hypothetical protein